MSTNPPSSAALQSPLIRLHHVAKYHDLPSGRCTALRDLTLQIDSAECVAVVGKSGSGKTTLINMLTGIDRPSAGEVHIAGNPVHTMSQESLARWRGRHVGVVRALAHPTRCRRHCPQPAHTPRTAWNRTR